MAGHSQFKNIMHRKGAQDAKRAKVFTKIIRELTVSAREGGSDPANNPRLKAAILSARQANMPKDTADRAIKRGAGHEDGTSYEEVRYEGYGPGGVALIVEGLTDNRNRTAPEVRTAFSKYGGSLGETNSVSFLFDHKGYLRFPVSSGSSDALFEAALEAGAEDVQSDPEGHDVYTDIESFSIVRDFLNKKFGEPEIARLTWVPKTLTPIQGDAAHTLLKLIDALEDNDDIQFVYANYDMPTSVLESFS